MAVIEEPQRSDLYTKVRHVLGAPLRSVELEDEQMDTLLEFAIGDYSQYINSAIWFTGDCLYSSSYAGSPRQT